MTVETLCDEERKARKRHRCDHCGMSIPAGSSYLYQFNKDGGDTWSFRCHKDCQKMSIAEAKEGGYLSDCYYDGLPILIDHDERNLLCDHWRGWFPHAVTRLELASQLSDIRILRRSAA